ncbi:hypothetical protein PHAVU_001G100501 [Phaseolus vulgaris]|uniref:Uncharacterized protein n=1 Tax=Phaseolus vulgaris TaxID=3885 RepID=V7AHG0_PHAVU|nr:hypothetical protein PHAVU_011G114800g [Phaseolus vulgaris]ESW04665.1 hypothetical protein PHAVU_011G114800g [Phaseolus vulgaris]
MSLWRRNSINVEHDLCRCYLFLSSSCKARQQESGWNYVERCLADKLFFLANLVNWHMKNQVVYLLMWVS